ncbi:MAG: 16S rRNA (guanine(966)-N(2))-methyltransferase RsmD [Clostridia bacterium]|nr:16S rRNA (guanine(966)-N(2))-methyltransferase RsmD [Clostridia bacterium]MBR6513135.1 16S rRNA (guanine(966)-N(2))-methyltransferase RsmD [Clostridia bacterium]
MRVITGYARGMKLRTLDGLDVRPTTDQVKESIFSIIQFEVEGARVLDLFAGSGQLGIEALSRGAQSVVFVDKSRAAVSVVKENLEHTRLAEKAIVRNEDSLGFLKLTKDVFDIAILDPPYGQGLITEALGYLPDVMSENGIIICETAKEETLPDAVSRFSKHKEYRYGKIKITVYRNKENDDDQSNLSGQF